LQLTAAGNRSAGDYRNRSGYFTIGVEVLFSDYIKEIATTVPGLSAANGGPSGRPEMVEKK
jgi:hypothetical protein